MPPPPPPPPPGPPPPSVSKGPQKQMKNGAQARSALLSDICKGKSLKPAAHLTVDKSKPIVGSEGMLACLKLSLRHRLLNFHICYFTQYVLFYHLKLIIYEITIIFIVFQRYLIEYITI